MYNLFYRIYFFRFKNNKIDSIFNRFIIRLINLIIPFLFTLNPVKSKLNFKSSDSSPKIIVSLTSFPVRIHKVWLVIETLLMQRTQPDKILLWLFKGEFNGRESLPEKLLNLEKRGLEIRFCDENLMPHKKYFFTMTEYPGADVITVDDDILYPDNFISKLLEYHNNFPDEIITTIGRKIKIIDNKIFPYKEWEIIRSDSSHSFQVIPIGAGGVYYPRGSLHADCFDIEKIKSYALMNSDLWLKIMSLRAETRVVCIAENYSKFFIPVIYRDNKTLMERNINNGRKDKVYKRLIDLYNIPINKLLN